MSTPRANPTFNRWWQLAIVFVTGLLLGAMTMVEIVPVSADGVPLAAAPSETASGPQGSGPQPADDPAVGGGPSESDQGAVPADPTSPAPGPSPETRATSNPNTGGATPPPPTTKPGIECAAGKNGGATDQGVTATEIKLATTVVESGIGSAFLGEMRYAMDAVVDKVNRAGGICGRQLKVTYRDDGWSAERGAGYLRTFINDGVFAIPVGPSSEGLNAVISSGDFDKAGVPVVGTDGLIVSQYQRADGSAQPWVWPIAVATVSSARIMAQDAYDRGARNFSIVFDSNYKFGVEAAEAFNAQVKALTGSDVAGYSPDATSCDQSYCGVTAGQSSYSSQVQTFQEGDFVALFLEPDTALKWMNDANAPKASDPAITYGFGAAQPLFTRSFGENCKSKCHGMKVWTGFKPFQEQYRSDPAVQEYVNDLRATNPSADENNQFSMGAYIGMQLLVDAIEAVGPELTRAKLQAQLNAMSLPTGLTLTDPLQFAPDNRYVATTMQAWEIQYQGTFAGWKAQQVVSDPRFGG